MALRAHLISLCKLQPNQTFALTEKCCPGEKEMYKYRLPVFLCCSAESSKELEPLPWKFIGLLYNVAVCIQSLKKKQHVWQFILGMAPIIRNKNSLPECEHSLTD